MYWTGYWIKNNMDEYIEFLKDYKECLDRIQNFEMYDYTETDVWAATKYTK